MTENPDNSTVTDLAKPCSHVQHTMSSICNAATDVTGSIHRVLIRHHSSSDHGRYFSLITFITAFAITLTLIIIDNIESSNAQPICPMIAVLVLMLLAIASMLVLLCSIQTGSEVNDVGRSWKIQIRQQLVLFGMVPFYFISISLLIHRIIEDTACWPAWSHSRLITNYALLPDQLFLSNLIFVHHARPVFNSVLCVFMGLEMILCCQFHNHRFKQNHLTLLSLAIIEATNLSVWLDMVLSESYIGVAKRHQENRKVELLLESGNFNWINVSTVEYNDTVDCLLENKMEHHLYETSSRLLYPFAVEFLFLATECGAFWFFNCATTGTMSEQSRNTKVKSGVEDHPLVEMISTAQKGDRDRNVTFKLALPEEFDEVEENSLLADDRLGVNDAPNVSKVNSRRRCAFPIHFVWTAMVGIINVLFINSGIMSQYFNDTYKTPVIVYRIAYLSFVCLCTWVCLLAVVCFSRSAQRKSLDISGFEYLVVITMLGPLCQVVFSVIADGPSVAIQEVLNAVEIIQQTLLYFKLSRLRPETDKKRWLIQGVLFLLLISNGVMWLEASLIETMSTGSSFKKQYNAVWSYIYALTNPVKLIYRFNSCILFINVYLENV